MSDSLQSQAVLQASLSITLSWSLLRLMSTESVMPSNHLILCHPLLLLPSIFPSIRVFTDELALCISWPKYWVFGFSFSPSNAYSGLVSSRIDWFDLLGVQGTPKSLLWSHQFFSTRSSSWSSSHCGWLSLVFWFFSHGGICRLRFWCAYVGCQGMSYFSLTAYLFN